jgi:hypothetical protein
MDISQSFIIKILLIGIVSLVLKRIFSKKIKKESQTLSSDIQNVNQQFVETDKSTSNSKTDGVFPQSYQVTAKSFNIKTQKIFWISILVLLIVGILFAPFGAVMTVILTILVGSLVYAILYILDQIKLANVSSDNNKVNNFFLNNYLDLSINIYDSSIAIQGKNLQLYKSIDCKSIEKIKFYPTYITSGYAKELNHKMISICLVNSFDKEIKVLDSQSNLELKFNISGLLDFNEDAVNSKPHKIREVMIQFAKINNIPIQNDYEE